MMTTGSVWTGRTSKVALLTAWVLGGTGAAEAQGVTAYRLHMAGAGGAMSISGGVATMDLGPLGTRGFVPEGGRLWMANRSRKTYWEGTLEEYCRSSGEERSRAEAEMLRRMGAHVPPGLREKVQEETQRQDREGADRAARKPTEAPAVTVSVESTGRTALIAGQPTEEFQVAANGKPYERLWLTTASPLAEEMNFADLAALMSRAQACATGDALAGMKRGFDQYRDPMGRRAIGADRFDALVESRRVAEAVQANDVYRRLLSGRWPLKRVSETGAPALEVTRLERVVLPASDLRPPAGFQQVAPGEVMAPR